MRKVSGGNEKYWTHLSNVRPLLFLCRNVRKVLAAFADKYSMEIEHFILRGTVWCHHCVTCAMKHDPIGFELFGNEGLRTTYIPIANEARLDFIAVLLRTITPCSLCRYKSSE